MKILIPFLCGVLLTTPIFGQTTPEDLIKKFFTEYESSGAKPALDHLYGTNKWIALNQDAIENVKTQLAGIHDIVGDYYGHEFITKQSAGESFHLFSYLVKYDRQPVRFTFEFYKPKDQWTLFSFSFDESVNEELEEAAKLQNLPRQ
ncbi:MAG: hypothetical protein H6561_01365 [Lewinellaceae bacterium]|nr:hypothetical protein [Lewinellaceae bacterium]HPR00968.1 hypothetical protein [Saprospiraceae bacterium]